MAEMRLILVIFCFLVPLVVSQGEHVIVAAWQLIDIFAQLGFQSVRVKERVKILCAIMCITVEDISYVSSRYYMYVYVLCSYYLR